MKIKEEEYFSDDFNADVNWLIGFDIEKEDAISFVNALLYSTPSENLVYEEEGEEEN